MSYVIGGVTFDLQPSSGGWVVREVLGIDGNAHPIYSSVREYQIEWGISDMSQFNEFLLAFENVHITGSAVVELPRWDGTVYEFREYSGCVVQEPEFDRYFAEHPTSIRLLITNIRT